jgi:hypothetical protein
MLSVQKLIVRKLICLCIQRQFQKILCHKMNLTDILYYQLQQQIIEVIIKVDFKGQYVL